MILCLDIGNSQLYGGVFHQGERLLQFRYDSKQASSSDQLGVFLKQVLLENAIEATSIRQIAICSVVPHLEYSTQAACKKYFSITPFFLKAGVKTGLKITYRNPLEVGADRIANAIAAVDEFPQQNLILVDFGTATTICAITADKRYLGGVILAGMRLSMEALHNHAAKLPPVEIVIPQAVLGRSTKESIQSGLYYGQLAAIRETVARISAAHFSGEPHIVIGTGGFARLFEQQGLFDHLRSDLVLRGVLSALQMNQPSMVDA